MLKSEFSETNIVGKVPSFTKKLSKKFHLIDLHEQMDAAAAKQQRKDSLREPSPFQEAIE